MQTNTDFDPYKTREAFKENVSFDFQSLHVADSLKATISVPQAKSFNIHFKVGQY